jgi:hypothetical protein
MGGPSASCTFWGMPAIIGVIMMPGRMVLTRTPFGHEVAGHGRVMAMTPPLEAL